MQLISPTNEMGVHNIHLFMQRESKNTYIQEEKNNNKIKLMAPYESVHVDVLHMSDGRGQGQCGH